jgi:hypothetical protein
VNAWAGFPHFGEHFIVIRKIIAAVHLKIHAKIRVKVIVERHGEQVSETVFISHEKASILFE